MGRVLGIVLGTKREAGILRWEIVVCRKRSSAEKQPFLFRSRRRRIWNAAGGYLMKKTQEEVLRLVRDFRNRLRPIYGDRLEGVYLYGSYARGEANENSDIDVAVLLREPVHQHAEIHRTSEIRAEISLDENCLLMPLFLSRNDFEKTPEAVYRRIAAEGLAV
jgi:predicted nucleotidyltransferase